MLVDVIFQLIKNFLLPINKEHNTKSKEILCKKKKFPSLMKPTTKTKGNLRADDMNLLVE